MNMTWFDWAWPWIGAVAAVVLLILLFTTDKLRSDKSVSRWRDITWLAWVAACAFFVHNLEEYGIDLLGNWHEFPNTFVRQMHADTSKGGLPPTAFFTAINMSAVWFTGPVAALLSKKHRLVGLAVFGMMFENALSHLGALSTGYNPGTFTSAVLFLPLFFWTVYACFGRGRMAYRGLFAILITGAIFIGILLVSSQLYLNGVLGTPVLVFLQAVNGPLLLFNTWVAEKLIGEKLWRQA